MAEVWDGAYGRVAEALYGLSCEQREGLSGNAARNILTCLWPAIEAELATAHRLGADGPSGFRAGLEKAIRAITVDMPNGEPNGAAERATEALQEALSPIWFEGGPQRVRAALAVANKAAADLCEALADDTRRLRLAAEAYFGGDFSKPLVDPASAIEEELQRAEDAPFICPGCQAMGVEAHAYWCPDASIERAREEGRHRRDYEPDDDDIDGHEEDGIPW